MSEIKMSKGEKSKIKSNNAVMKRKRYEIQAETLKDKVCKSIKEGMGKSCELPDVEFRDFERIFAKIECKKDELLANYSTMKVGGRAKCIVFPKNFVELKKVFEEIEKCGLRHFVLGNGSNVLFDDEGFDGVIVSLKHFQKVQKCGVFVTFGAGINLFLMNNTLAKMGLSGLEWSYGIPGTLGGLLFMNGGSFGHEICEFVEEVVVFENGRLKRLRKPQLKFAYRKSNLSGSVILSAKLRLKQDDSEFIMKRMKENLQKKREMQPCEFPSLGSVFKQVPCGTEVVYPAKLIDNLGLKGVKIGGAEISQKHAGFIINVGGATAKDILALIDFVDQKLQKMGVFAQKEIIFLKN